MARKKHHKKHSKLGAAKKKAHALIKSLKSLVK